MLLIAVVHPQAMAKEIWYCPMHPQYTSDKAGKCPICGMDLVKKEGHAHVAGVGIPDHAVVAVSRAQEQLMGIHVALAERRVMTKTIRVPGTVAYDQDLYKAEQEYVEALITFERLNRRISKGNIAVKDAKRRLQWLEWELRHMGTSDAAIETLQSTKDVDHDLLLGSSTGTVWIYAQIFESDLGFVDVGQKALVEVPSFAEKFEGIVRSVDPMVDAVSRTVRVRIELKKVRSELKPNMLVNVTMVIDLNSGLAVPRDAVLDTGMQKIVFVQKDHGTFEPRVVKTGFEADGFIDVTSGLSEGEKVAVEGNFLLDSESRLQASISGGADAGGEHQHGQ